MTNKTKMIAYPIIGVAASVGVSKFVLKKTGKKNLIVSALIGLAAGAATAYLMRDKTKDVFSNAAGTLPKANAFCDGNGNVTPSSYYTNEYGQTLASKPCVKAR